MTRVQYPPCTMATDALADELARMLERLITDARSSWGQPSWWASAESAYNPVTRTLTVRYRGVWHTITIQED